MVIMSWEVVGRSLGPGIAAVTGAWGTLWGPRAQWHPWLEGKHAKGPPLDGVHGFGHMTHRLLMAQQGVQDLRDGPGNDKAEPHQRPHKPGRVGAHLEPVPRAYRLRNDLPCMAWMPHLCFINSFRALCMLKCLQN